tara:strand:+ start:158 stop:748 length:591 start_codon:yes stop_codon:yes gene_type:complete
MRKVDIVIELDESTLKNLNNWFEQVQQCNPRFVEFGSKELANGNSDMVLEWDRQGKLRNRFMGEIGRQGSRLLKPVEINYTLMIKILIQWIQWFCYKLDMLQKNHKYLKKSLKENELVKTPNSVLEVSNISILQMKKLIAQVTEFKMLFIWCNEFSVPALNSNPMPDVIHCTWMLTDMNYCEHPENKRKNKFQFYK